MEKEQKSSFREEEKEENISFKNKLDQWKENSQDENDDDKNIYIDKIIEVEEKDIHKYKYD